MNLHDIYNRDAAAGQKFLKDVFTTLKPGGVFSVIDHVGNSGGENQKLHRMPKSVAIDGAKAAGFVVGRKAMCWRIRTTITRRPSSIRHCAARPISSC